MIRPSTPRVRLVTFVIAGTLGLGAWFYLAPSARKLCCASVYKTFTSPDQRFHLTVYRLGWPWPVPPGSAGDAPGFVRLHARDEAVLQEQDIPMVQLVDQVDWQPRRVEIRLLADWPLPGP
jgi:hypothetical protein